MPVFDLSIKANDEAAEACFERWLDYCAEDPVAYGPLITWMYEHGELVRQMFNAGYVGALQDLAAGVDVYERSDG